jgi:hypothetical protein
MLRHILLDTCSFMCFPGGTMNIHYSNEELRFSGPGGSLAVHPDDEISRRLAMLLAGECGGIGATGAARMFDFSRQRYYQLRGLYRDGGAAVVAQKLRQLGHAISTRSVERIIADYGLQKKTPHA